MAVAIRRANVRAVMAVTLAEIEIEKIDRELVEMRKALPLVTRPSQKMVWAEIDKLLERRHRLARPVNAGVSLQPR